MIRKVNVPKPRRGPQRVQILALSGGGFRGLYTARVLELLEKRLSGGRILRDAFDLIAGTSIGGIIAIAVARGVPAAKIRSALQDHGPRIFGAKKAKGALAAMYAAEPLREAIEAIIGAARISLADLNTAVYIPAVNRTTGAATAFVRVPGRKGAFDGVALVDVAMATAAAPIYFPVHAVGSDEYVDGGLYANAPDLGAVAFAMEAFAQSQDNLHMLSIGTTSAPAGQDPLADADRGGLDWLSGIELVNLTFAAQETHTQSICARLLRRRYVRLNRDQQPAHVSKLGLDKADNAAAKILLALADATVHDMTSGQIDGLLGHRARHVAKSA